MTSIEKSKIDEILSQVRSSLSDGDLDGAIGLLTSLRPPDQAGLFGDLPHSDQDKLLPHLSPEYSADILEELEDEEAAEIASRLKLENLIPILDHMEPDEAADLLGDISPDQAAEALAVMTEAEDVRPLLAHTDESAGGLMTALEITFHEKMTAEEAIAHLRQVAPDSETIYYLFIVDDENLLIGVISLRQLVIAPPITLVEDIMDLDYISIRADADQEEAARLMSRYDLLALPVLDNKGQLLGVITYDDLVDVLEDEATEDIYRLGGVPEGKTIDVSLPVAMSNRLPWLVLNLVTAMASAFVLSRFENTIAQVAALAAFFPIVAGVSGSAGTQTLTVIVRGLALRQLDPRDGINALFRELLIGLVNGLTLGILVAMIALFWKGTPILGLVVGIATFLNMIGAGIAGVVTPFGIQVLRIDPALASPILVSTVTDTLGYFIYLGLATIFLSRLL